MANNRKMLRFRPGLKQYREELDLTIKGFCKINPSTSEASQRKAESGDEVWDQTAIKIAKKLGRDLTDLIEDVPSVIANRDVLEFELNTNPSNWVYSIPYAGCMFSGDGFETSREYGDYSLEVVSEVKCCEPLTGAALNGIICWGMLSGSDQYFMVHEEVDSNAAFTDALTELNDALSHLQSDRKEPGKPLSEVIAQLEHGNKLEQALRKLKEVHRAVLFGCEMFTNFDREGHNLADEIADQSLLSGFGSTGVAFFLIAPSRYGSCEFTYKWARLVDLSEPPLF